MCAEHKVDRTKNRILGNDSTEDVNPRKQSVKDSEKGQQEKQDK